MYDQYDLKIYQSDVIFEKAYNEFELLSGLSMITEADDSPQKDTIASKASKTFFKLVDAVREFISKIVDKITSILTDKKFNSNEKIESDINPEDVIKENDKQVKKHFQLINKVKKSKNPSELSDEVEETVAPKKRSKKEIVKKVLITEAIIKSASILLKSSLRTYDKLLAKTKETTPTERLNDVLHPDQKVELEKQKLISMLLRSIKGVISDDINSIKSTLTFSKKPETSDREWGVAKSRLDWEKMDPDAKASISKLDKVTEQIKKQRNMK
jgi:hypothetical protein